MTSGRDIDRILNILRTQFGEGRWMIVAVVCIAIILIMVIFAVVHTLWDGRLRRNNEMKRIRRNEQIMRLVAGHSDRVIFSYDIATHVAQPLRSEDESFFEQEQLEQLPELSIKTGFIMPESVDDVRRMFSDIDKGVPCGSYKMHAYTKNGQCRWLDVKFTTVKDEKARAYAIISLLDVTDEYIRQLAYERFRQMEENKTGEGGFTFIVDVTADLVERQYNVRHQYAGLNYTVSLFKGFGGRIFSEDGEWGWEFFSREHLLMLYSIKTHHIDADWTFKPEDSEEVKWMHVDVDLVQDPYSGHIKAFVRVNDITAEKMIEIEHQRASRMDGLTGLYSRNEGEQLIRKFFDGDSGQRCALLIVDLDNLKSINDNLGHMEGDRAIKLVAEAMRSQLRATDIIARLGGDEFIALLPFVKDNAHLDSTMLSLMQAIAAIRIGAENDVRVSLSVGGTYGKTGRDTFETLYDQADRALYHVKRGGKNNYAFYTEEMVGEDYHYRPNAGLTLDYTSMPAADIQRLLSALGYVYPVMIFCDYTKNTYKAIQFAYDEQNWFRPVGQPDELMEDIAKILHPEDREAFLATFSAENLGAQYAADNRHIVYNGRQISGEDEYCDVRIHFVFSPPQPEEPEKPAQPGQGDARQGKASGLCGVLFARVCT